MGKEIKYICLNKTENKQKLNKQTKNQTTNKNQPTKKNPQKTKPTNHNQLERAGN